MAPLTRFVSGRLAPNVTPFHPYLTNTSVHVQLRSVLSGAGVGILPDFMSAGHDSLVKVLPYEISFNRSFWFVVHEDYAQLERIRVCAAALIAGMCDAFKKGPEPGVYSHSM